MESTLVKTKKEVKTVDINGYTGFDYSDDTVSIDDAVFFGMEIELEYEDVFNPFPFQRVREAFLKKLKVFNVNGKSIIHDIVMDGSLDNGLEIVFNPMTLDFLEFFKERFSDILNIFRFYGFKADRSTCGLHIHISNTVFFNDKFITEGKNHLNAFVNFIMNNKFFFYEVSERLSRNDRFFRFDGTCKNSHYEAISTLPEDDVEVRFFQSTTDGSLILERIRFLLDIIEYTSKIDYDSYIYKIDEEDVHEILSIHGFIDYLKTMNRRYHFVFQALENLEIRKDVVDEVFMLHQAFKSLDSTVLNPYFEGLKGNVDIAYKQYLDLFYVFKDKDTDESYINSLMKTIESENSSGEINYDSEILEISEIAVELVKKLPFINDIIVFTEEKEEDIIDMFKDVLESREESYYND